MYISKSEKIVIVVLSCFLFIGTVVNYRKRARADFTISIKRGLLEEELSLEEVKESMIKQRKVRVNSATKEMIMSISGIGKVLAERIVNYRDANGCFLDKRDLLNVKGISEKKLEKIEHMVLVE